MFFNLRWLGEPNFGNALARTSTNGLWFTDD